MSFDLTRNWTQHVAYEVDTPVHPPFQDIQVSFENTGKKTGSWLWRGVEAANRAVRELGIAMYLLRWAADERDYEPLLRLLSGDGTSAMICRSATSLIRGLLGDVDQRRQILRAIDELGGPGAAEQLGLPLAFTRMDQRTSLL